MTSALLALSRQLVALPGFPPRDMIADELVCGEAVEGWPGFRDKAGILWRPDTEADRPAPWLPDLTDPATGGVLLNLIPPNHRHRVSSLPGGLYKATVRDLGRMGDSICLHLAEAAARVLVAPGRVGDV